MQTQNEERITYGSSCGIKSVNEYQNHLPGGTPKIAKDSAQTRDGRAWAGAKATNHMTGVFSAEASAGASAMKTDDMDLLTAKAGADAQFGLGGAIAEASGEASIMNFNNGVEVLKGSVGGEVCIGAGGVKAKVDAGVDLVAVEKKTGGKTECQCQCGFECGYWI